MHTLIHSDDQKDIYCVQVTVERKETVQSGSMQFTHPRYITFGQVVIFTEHPIECSSEILTFRRGQESELERLFDHIKSEKECPQNTTLFAQEE